MKPFGWVLIQWDCVPTKGGNLDTGETSGMFLRRRKGHVKTRQNRGCLRPRNKQSRGHLDLGFSYRGPSKRMHSPSQPDRALLRRETLFIRPPRTPPGDCSSQDRVHTPFTP